MKIKEDNRTDTEVEHQVRRCHGSQCAVMTGMALLLSAGLNGEATAFTVIIPYDYIITANTCTLTSSGESVGQFSTQTGPQQTGDFSVKWPSSITRANLKGDDKDRSVKQFGFSMDCQGDIWQPKLTIRASNQSYSADNKILYTTETPDSPAGFAVQLSSTNTAPELTGADIAATGPGISLSETSPGNRRAVQLQAWPTLMPGKELSEVRAGMDITGTVVIEVQYN